MHTDSAKVFWKSVWVVIGMVVLNAVAATDAPEDFQVVDGVAI